MEIKCWLVKNPDYVNLVNRIIEDEKLKYALPVYNIEYIRNMDKNLNFNTDPDEHQSEKN